MRMWKRGGWGRYSYAWDTYLLCLKVNCLGKVWGKSCWHMRKIESYSENLTETQPTMLSAKTIHSVTHIGIPRILQRSGSRGEGRARKSGSPSVRSRGKAPVGVLWTKSGSLKVGRLHKGKKNNVISGFIRSLVLNTIIFIDACVTWRLEWCTTVCSVLMIVILLFNLLFRSMSSFRGVRCTAVQMPMLRGCQGWIFLV